ncbi:hypothetical protein GGR55DRAFT_131226 [Xylaria sp. FL0064]|nr:hypothetical protein GGR55DRAFT_131226 [Xylaria sp. FL0064]
MMHLIRRRFGARDPITTNNTEMVDSNPPPSYEDSQNASLQEILQGARAILPLLWPSTSDTPSSSSPLTTTTFAPSASKQLAEYESMVTNTRPEPPRIGRATKSEETISSSEQDAIIEVLANLAMAPCSGCSFLDRIRQFSDFYFTPYMASEGDCHISSRPDNNDIDSHKKAQQRGSVTPQEKQRKVLASISAPRESIALVLCARVLEGYYSKLEHVESAGEVNIPRIKTRITRITRIAACPAGGCTCCDFNEAIPFPISPSPSPSPSTPVPALTQEINPKLSIATSPHCGCGHPRTSHSPSAGATGLSRLLRRYTNWDSASYAALGHRSPAGAPKRRVVEIRVCGTADCACRDYDKGRRTGRCARCGHYDEVHHPVNVALEKQQQQRQQDQRRKRNGVGSMTSETDSTPKGAEWELSWILVENAYLLLDRIAPFS